MDGYERCGLEDFYADQRQQERESIELPTGDGTAIYVRVHRDELEIAATVGGFYV